MVLGRFKLVVLLSLIVLVACNDSQEGKGDGQSSPFLNLSTDNQGEEQPEQPLDTPLNELIENREPSEEKNLEEEGITEETEEMEQNQADQQRALTVEPVSPEKPEELKDTSQKEQFDVETKLPFENFKERWNAVSDANFSNLYIKGFKESTNDLGITHTATLNEQMELNVHTTSGFVQSLEIIAQGNVNIPMMLTGWSQVISILHPDLAIHDVDALFNELGIGPNGDLSNLKEGTFPFNQLSYSISRIENGYIFQGSYN